MMLWPGVSTQKRFSSSLADPSEIRSTGAIAAGRASTAEATVVTFSTFFFRPNETPQLARLAKVPLVVAPAPPEGGPANGDGRGV